MPAGLQDGRSHMAARGEEKTNLDHIPEFHDLLASVLDIFGLAGHEHPLQLFANLAQSSSVSPFSSRQGDAEHLWDGLHRRILECCCLGHGVKRWRVGDS
jgi:hypothetical protein